MRNTRFKIKKFYMVLALRWVFCTDLRTDSDHCFIHNQLTAFYNRGGKCLQRVTDWFLIRGGADKSLTPPTSRCRRMKSIVSLERGGLFMRRIASLFLLQRMKESMSGDARVCDDIETWAFIKFFFLQGKAPKEIHAILTEILREYAPSYATVKNWVA